MYYILYALSFKLGVVRTSIKYTIHCQMLSFDILLQNIVSDKCGLDSKTGKYLLQNTSIYCILFSGSKILELSHRLISLFHS